ncbi:MAG: hypothetical protein Q6K12_00575 [Gloeomargarita sp. DG_1_6_bins_138]
MGSGERSAKRQSYCGITARTDVQKTASNPPDRHFRGEQIQPVCHKTIKFHLILLRIATNCTCPRNLFGTITFTDLGGVMADKVRHLSVRLSDEENQALEYYCHQTSQSKTEVIREFIRSLVYTNPNNSSPKST